MSAKFTITQQLKKQKPAWISETKKKSLISRINKLIRFVGIVQEISSFHFRFHLIRALLEFNLIFRK